MLSHLINSCIPHAGYQEHLWETKRTLTLQDAGMTTQVSSQLRDVSQDSYSSSATEEPYLLAAHGGSRPTKGSAFDTQQSGPPEDFVCPISLDVMRDPVTLVCTPSLSAIYTTCPELTSGSARLSRRCNLGQVETGQNFDRPSLERWFKTGAQTCPLTRVQLSKKEVRLVQPFNNNNIMKMIRGSRQLTKWLAKLHADAVQRGAAEQDHDLVCLQGCQESGIPASHADIP